MDTAQTIVHSLEQGRASRIIRVALIIFAIIGVGALLLLARFRGFYHSEAMDLAQSSRQLSEGKGFTTRDVKPLALWQIGQHRGAQPNLGQVEMPDTFNQPLPVIFNVLPLKLAGDDSLFGQSAPNKQITYIPAGERWIAAFAMACFMGAIAVGYFLARRLFDQRLALLAAALLVVCDLFWQFSLSGLPQMLMLLIFMGTLYAVARVIEENLQSRLALSWTALAALGFGLLAQCHGLAFWPFLGFVIFAAVYLQPRGLAAGVALVVFLAVCAPWLIRNYQVCGNPFGTAGYLIYDGVKGTASTILRSSPPDLEGVSPIWWRPKIQAGLLTQIGALFGLLGSSLVAPLFFVSLLHPFKRKETAHFRWAVLSMWITACFGMAVFGIKTDDMVSANQLHVLFIPVMVFFGLAFVLILVSRLSFAAVPLLQRVFLGALIFVSALPLILALLPTSAPPVRYPPYMPPAVNLLTRMTQDNEVIVSDQPWAVAWYANRKSLWLPAKFADFVAMCDYNKLGAPIAGVHLSPTTSQAKFSSELLRGEFKEWVQVIARSPGPNFPFKDLFPLPVEGESAFYSDKKRWESLTPIRGQ